MKKSILFTVLGMAFLLVSCGPSRDKTVSLVDSMEKSLYAADVMSYNKEKADSLLALYEGFVKDYPTDSLSPGYLFKAANIVMNSGNGAKAIGLFDQYLKDYPDKPKAPLCMFFKAFVYENVNQDLDKAREIYLQYLEKYPNDDFAKDARMALMNLGKSPEMLVQEFEAKKKADSLRMADSLANIKKSKKH